MFEFNISKQQLLTPLLTVAGAVDKKQSLAILSNVLLKQTDQQLLLTATDLEIEITAIISCTPLQGAGSITVPAKKMVDIIRSLNEDANPTVSCDSKILTIKEGRSLFKLATLPAENYPNSEEEHSEVEFSLSRSHLIRLLQSTHFAMSQQDVRVFLNGLLLELDNQFITAVATDGHRMAICRLPCQTVNTHHRLLIPRKGVQEILRLLNNISDEQLSLSVGKNHF
ncbi:DNA polymerase III subunit beta, partial [Legionella oakridgensis]